LGNRDALDGGLRGKKKGHGRSQDCGIQVKGKKRDPPSLKGFLAEKTPREKGERYLVRGKYPSEKENVHVGRYSKKKGERIYERRASGDDLHGPEKARGEKKNWEVKGNGPVNGSVSSSTKKIVIQ